MLACILLHYLLNLYFHLFQMNKLLEDTDSESEEDYKEDLEFFSKLEKDLHTKIPPFIKCSLIACQMNDELTISKMNVEDFMKFLDSDKGKKILKGMFKSSKKAKVLEFLEQPSSIFDVPGNTVRLDGIIEHCKAKQQSQRDKIMKAERITCRPSSSASTGQAEYKEKESDESHTVLILKTIKKKVDGMNVAADIRPALATPDISICHGLKELSAQLTCCVCSGGNKKQKDVVSTIYKKGLSCWKIQNYVRHIERNHLIEPKSSASRSMDEFVSKSKVNKDSTSDAPTDKQVDKPADDSTNSKSGASDIAEHVEISDEEEERRRQSLDNSNF